MAMEHQDIEEQNARCNICSRGLLPIEAFLYGNRCVFCTEPTRIGIFRWILHSTVDYLIYLQMLRIKKFEDARFKFLGALSMFARDINEIKSIFTKLELLRELRGIK